MATLNIKDERVHALATELARLRGTTATSAVLDALTVEMERNEPIMLSTGRPLLMCREGVKVLMTLADRRRYL